MMRLMYHVTHRRNRASIWIHGVHPGFTQGRQQITWWATGAALAWAKNHVCERHGWSPDDLAVFVISLPLAVFTRTRWQGVYTIAETLRPDAEIPADA